MAEHNLDDQETMNPYVIPRVPESLPRPKPKLLIVLPDLIHQWCNEIREFSDVFKPLVYYGDKRIVMLNTTPKVNGNLMKEYKIFDRYYKQDEEWNLDLSNKFEFTAIDEAHVIKNATTTSHIMVR